MQKFAPNQLSKVLDDYAKKQFTGIVQIDVDLLGNAQKRSRLIVFEQGEITYAGLNLPKAQTLVEQMGQHLRRSNIAPAMDLANKQSNDTTRLCDYLKLFFRLGIFKWSEFEQFMQNNIIWTLEQISPYAGTAAIASQENSVLNYLQNLPQYNWKQLAVMLELRQQEWLELSPFITSVEVVPKQLPGVTQVKSSSILAHLKKHVNGQRTLTQIAYSLKQDPLRLAQTYYKWIEKGWLSCQDHKQCSRPMQVVSSRLNLPVILSVDDSPVVQMMLKRSISDQYQVLVANNAVEALNLLNSKSVDLVLLDVTMPDIDGLELCRTMRSISKFRDLPVIMLTAKDGMLDKVKGKMAGSTHYLAKSVSREKLLELIQKSLPAETLGAYEGNQLQYAA